MSSYNNNVLQICHEEICSQNHIVDNAHIWVIISFDEKQRGNFWWKILVELKFDK